MVVHIPVRACERSMAAGCFEISPGGSPTWPGLQRELTSANLKLLEWTTRGEGEGAGGGSVFLERLAGWMDVEGRGRIWGDSTTYVVRQQPAHAGNPFWVSMRRSRRRQRRQREGAPYWIIVMESYWRQRVRQKQHQKTRVLNKKEGAA